MSAVDAIPLLAAAGGDYQISRSVRLRSSASAYFNRTVWGSGNRKTWSYSFWLKRGVLNSERVIAGAYDGTSTWASRFLFTSSNAMAFDLGLSAQNQTLTAAVFRDPSAWYHIVLVIDTTQSQTLHSQPDSRVRIYVNGTQQTTSGTLPGLNVDTQFCINTRTNYIGTRNTEYFDGYLTEINFIDGQALTLSSFGEFNSITGVWQPKKYAGTYGTNGFYLNFSDNSAATAAAIGKDYSGNGNNWTPNNISVTAGVTYDSMLDVPTMWADGGNGRGNYATLNPLVTTNAAPTTFSEANLRVDFGSSSTGWAHGSIGVSTGKWYAEFTLTSVSSTNAGVGLKSDSSLNYAGFSANSYAYENSGNKRTNDTASAYGASFTSGNVIGVAYDADAGTLTFYKNNVSQGQAFSGITGTNYFVVSDNSTSPTCVWQANFGQRPFAYTPPTGFKALNTQNLPASTIVKGNLNFDATLYTGNGATQTIVNAGGFAPNFVWLKARSAATNNRLYDSVRGANLILSSNTTDQEGTPGGTGGLTSFNSNGFTLGNAVSDNGNAVTFVGWQWKAGGAAVTNTAGSITSQVSANVSAGISVVTYTGNGVAGATVGHGLGVAPKMVIVKQRNVVSVTGWNVYHASVGNTAGMYLNLTTAATTGAGFWNNTSPTSSVFSLGTGVDGNANGSTYVAYCFTEVAGFSKFGGYTGNGSTDGQFLYCGFKPAFVMVKGTNTASNWQIFDDMRAGYNVDNKTLYANLANAEATDNAIDLLSNGFKMRSATVGNSSAITYIFAAFAENPFKNALAR